jgi:hypothetical protein
VYKRYINGNGCLNTIFSLVIMNVIGSRDSSVGLASGYGLDHQGVGVRLPVVSRIFST